VQLCWIERNLDMIHGTLGRKASVPTELPRTKWRGLDVKVLCSRFRVCLADKLLSTAGNPVRER